MNGRSETIRVLHVDDDPGLADVSATFLEREDDRIVVRSATSAAEGLEVLETTEVDCVVSDYDMPGQNGIEFLEAVRETYPDLPFILYTGKGSEEVASEAISAGVTDYMQKETGADQYAVLANRVANSVEQYRAEQEADRTRRRLETLTSNLPGIAYRARNEPGWPMEVVRGECEVVTGYSADAVESGTVSWGDDVLHPDDREEMWGAVQEAIEDDRPFEVTYRIRTKSRETRWMWERGRLVDADLHSREVLKGFITDITERRQREQELRRYEACLEESTDIITVLDDDGTVKYQSPSVTRMLGYGQEDLVGENGFDYIHPEDVEDLYAAFADLVMDSGTTATVESRFRTADGDWVWLEVHGKNQLENDAIRGIVTNNRDITERKHRQQDLERTNALLSTLVETLPVGVLAEDGLRNVLAVNERLLELFDIKGSPAETVGADCERLAREVSGVLADPEEFVARIDRLVDTRESVRGEELHLRDGRTFARSHEPIELPEGEGYLWVYWEITERRDRERRLRETTSRLEALFEQSPDMINVHDTEGTIIDPNPRLVQKTGYDREELAGMKVWELDRTLDREAARTL